MSTLGQQERDAGAAAVDAAGTAAHRTWKPKADAALAKLIREGQPFTADHLDELVGEAPHHPNAIGALFLHASRRGEIRKIGYAQARARSRRAGNMAVWIAV